MSSTCTYLAPSEIARVARPGRRCLPGDVGGGGTVDSTAAPATRCAQTPVAAHRGPRRRHRHQAYYRLVSEGLIPHTAPTYRRLSARLAQARREERFPDLIDPLREVYVPPAWQDVGGVPPGRARLVRPGPDRRPVVSPVRGLREGHATGSVDRLAGAHGDLCARPSGGSAARATCRSSASARPATRAGPCSSTSFSQASGSAA
jgi:hypothetical protein